MVCDDIEGPLVLWLQGGPGWPSMFGMFKENGPFSIHVERKGNNKKIRDNFRPHPIWMILSEEGRKVCSKLMRNPDSWHQDASMLYIDSPVRVGRAGFHNFIIKIIFRLLDIHHWMQKLKNYLAYIICSIHMYVRAEGNREIWAKVEVRWEQDSPTPKAPPTNQPQMHRCLAVQCHIICLPCLTCSPAGGSSFGWGTQASTFLSGRIFKYKFSFRQFFILIPHYIPGFNPATNPFFVFGESYGGPHVLQLAVGSGWCWCRKCGDDDVGIFMLMAYKLEEIKYCLESFQLGFNHLWGFANMWWGCQSMKRWRR